MRCSHCMKEITQNAKFCPYCGKNPREDNPQHHLSPGTVLHDRYILGNTIGEGGFGITYVAYDKNLDLKIAVKEFFPSGYANRNKTLSKDVTLNYNEQGEYFRKGKENFLREAKSIAKFSSEDSIVDVRDYFAENNTAYIVMEYLEGENLNKHIKSNGVFKAEEIFRLMLPIMNSLKKMHDEKIVHRDISPDNIMYLKSGKLKLMDFGSARYFTGAEQKTMSVMLKPGYAPYEQYGSGGKQGPWTDVYGICATIYKCITGITPPDSLDRCHNDTLKNPSELGADISKGLEDVLMYGMAIYESNRCRDMDELSDITEKALNDQPVTFINAGNSDDAERLNRTKDADARYKTMFANAAYTQPDLSKQNDRPQPAGDMWKNYDRHTPPQPPAPEPQKNNNALIAVLIALTAAIVLGIGVLTFVIVNSNSDNKGETETTTRSTTQETTASDNSSATTSPATTAPPTTAATPTTVPSVKLANVTGKPLAEAKKSLEAQGMTVSVVEEESEAVEKGRVIRQSISANETVQKGTPVTLYISKGTSKNTKPYDQKVVVTAAAGSSYGTLTLYEWENGGWVNKFSCDATVGADGISSDNSESNTCTPYGEFPLGVVLSASSPNTGMVVHNVTSATVVCDDVNSGYYNQIGTQAQFGNAHTDPIGKKLTNGQNNSLIFIEHNGNGFSSDKVRRDNSSVITICGCYASLSPTGGCIDISASNMDQLLRLLTAAKNPYIITEVK